MLVSINVLSGSIFHLMRLFILKVTTKMYLFNFISTACRISTLERLLVGDNRVMQRSDLLIICLQPVGYDKTGTLGAFTTFAFICFQQPNLCPFRALQVY